MRHGAPVTIIGLGKHHDALALCFQGLLEHYVECMASNRMEDWERCAVALVQYFAHDPPGLERAKRSDI